MFAFAPWGLSIGDLIVYVLIIAGALAIGWVILTKALGIAIPDWFRQVILIVIAVVVGVLAIKIIISM